MCNGHKFRGWFLKVRIMWGKLASMFHNAPSKQFMFV